MRLRRADAQPPARRASIGNRLFGIAEVGEDAPRGAQIGLALGGQRERARRAQQQPHAQPRLDPVDRAAHRRRREPEAAAGGRKTALGNRDGKDFHCARPVAGFCDLCVHFKNPSPLPALLR